MEQVILHKILIIAENRLISKLYGIKHNEVAIVDLNQINMSQQNHNVITSQNNGALYNEKKSGLASKQDGSRSINNQNSIAHSTGVYQGQILNVVKKSAVINHHLAPELQAHILDKAWQKP